jgi:hypothetical protein
MAAEGATTAGVFETYLEYLLAPGHSPGQVVMDILGAHKAKRGKEVIEERGCELFCRPIRQIST